MPIATPSFLTVPSSKDKTGILASLHFLTIAEAFVTAFLSCGIITAPTPEKINLSIFFSISSELFIVDSITFIPLDFKELIVLEAVPFELTYEGLTIIPSFFILGKVEIKVLLNSS